MKKRLFAAALVCASLALGGCGAAVSGLSSHTISTGPDQQADVVWVTVDGRPTRCTATASGPVCRRAQIQ